MNTNTKEFPRGVPLFEEGDNPLFNRMAEQFDRPPLGFWSLIGKRLVELAQLKPAQQVLDIGSGTGAVSLPAAAAVYPQGSVLGIDIAQNMVDEAGRRAREAGVPRVSFHCADVATFTSNRRYDAILGGFSLFFVEDMRGALEKFRNWMKPGGTWAFSFWAQQPFAPLGDMLLEDLAVELPDLPDAIAAFRARYANQGALAELFAGFGGHVSLVTESYLYPIGTADKWWTLATNTGLRNFIDRVEPTCREAFKRRHLQRVTDSLGQHTLLTVSLPTQFVVVRFDP